jgi:hypothetical protein
MSGVTIIGNDVVIIGQVPPGLGRVLASKTGEF